MPKPITPIFQIQNLTLSFPAKNLTLFHNLDFCVHEGDFVLICGTNGSGKSTLARLLTGSLDDTSHLQIQGKALYRGKEIPSLDRRYLCSKIGAIWQNPYAQSLASSVELEIAFTLENLGLPPEKIRRRVAEIAAIFGLENLLEKNPRKLSGGELQKVMLASAVTSASDVLVLDEPLSRLDPPTANLFPLLLEKIRNELGLTILIFENRIDPCLPIVNRAALLHHGKICLDLPPAIFVQNPQIHHLGFSPKIASWFAQNNRPERPLTLPDAVAILRNNPPPPYQKNTHIPQPPRKPKVLTFQNVIYSKKEDSFVINIKDLSIYSGEIVAILGSNGAGKTTLLLLALGILEPTSGKIHRNFPSTLLNENFPTKAFWIPQEPEDALWQDSVRSVLETLTPNSFDTPHLSQIISRFSLQNLLPLHPRNLSGGEKARLLLASALLAQPAVLLADEPTRELDPRWYSEAQNLFRELAAAGSAILLATEDTELAAAIADRAIILQRGKIIASGPTHQILDDGIFYTSVENRIRKSLEK